MSLPRAHEAAANAPVAPPAAEAESVTRLLQRWRRGDRDAVEELLPLVYEELRRRASRYLRRERAGHTLQTTALVHEAYLRLTGGDTGLEVEDRLHFFRLAAQTMRRVLVDHARRQQAGKRIGAHQKTSLDGLSLRAAPLDVKVLAVHQALERLAALHARQARLVELLYFGGLTHEEAAEALGVSPATVSRDWNVARRWLFARLGHG